MSSRLEKMTLYEAKLLKNTCFSHIRAEIHLFSDDSYGQYEKMSSESRLLELPVELCLVTGSNWSSDLQRFLTLFRNNPVQLSSIILLSQNHRATPAELISEGIPFIRKHFNNVAAGAGTNCNFAQLNRQPPDPELLDFISFAIHPQEHAGDDRTLFENTAAQRDAVESALKLAGNKPVHVSPVTLVRRFNAGESNYEIAADRRLLPAQVDVRQMSLFGAAWTVGSMKYLFESGVDSVTYYEGVGERGIMTGDYPSAWPLEFRADKDMLYPVYHIFRMIKQNYRVIRSISNFPLFVDGFVLVAENGGIIFLSNFTATDQTVEITGFTGLQTLFLMNTTNFNKVVRNEEFSYPLLNTGTTISMKPYETRFLKFATPGLSADGQALRL